VRHSLELPQVFEDQRSGETLGKLQRCAPTWRSSHSSLLVNILFIPGWALSRDLVLSVYWPIAAVYFLTIAAAGLVEVCF
jgi:hypothetical protein